MKKNLLYYQSRQRATQNAGMAQSVEHVIGNDEVISSILITSSKKARLHTQACFFSFIQVLPVCPKGHTGIFA